MVINLGIDLDETLIDNIYTFENKKYGYKFKKDALKCLTILYDKGFRFHLITARKNYSDIRKSVYDIVEYIELKCSVKFESITFTSGKKKGHYSKIKGCKYMIDDQYDYLTDCEENDVIPLLLAKKKEEDEFCSKIKCFKDWYEITEYIIDNEVVIFK